MTASADAWAWLGLHVNIYFLMVDVHKRLQGKSLQCMALYSAVLSITGNLYIWVDVGCIQQKTWIYFRHKSRDDPHLFARSTRSAQAANIHCRGSVHNSIVGMINCFGTTRASIQLDPDYIPWGNTVTLTNRDAISSINKIMATYTWLSRYYLTMWTYLGTISPCELVCIICTISPDSLHHFTITRLSRYC